MIGGLYFATCAAGFVYGVTPGPAVLALFGIAASQGRRAGGAFLCGHLLGDLLWCGLALVAIVGAKVISAVFFDILGFTCGLYLFWLGGRALATRRSTAGGDAAQVSRPLIRGVLFGLSNPKGYPVAIATFTAILAGYAGGLDWWALPPLLGAAAVGFIVAYLVLLALVGTAPVRALYRRHEAWITRLSGALFIGFALNAVLHSWTNFASRRA